MSEQAAALKAYEQASRMHGRVEALEAVHLWQDAARACQRAGLVDHEGDCNNNASALLRDLGDLNGAEQAARRAIELYDQIGDRRKRNLAVFNLSRVVEARGDLPGACALLNEARESLSTWGDEDDQAACLLRLAPLQQASGWFAEARHSLKQARELLILTKNRVEEARAVTLLANTYGLEAPAETAKLLREAVVLYQEVGDEQRVALLWGSIAEMYDRARDENSARNAWETAAHRFEPQGLFREAGQAFMRLAILRRDGGLHSDALEAYRQARASFQKVAEVPNANLALGGVGSLLARRIRAVRERLRSAPAATVPDPGSGKEREVQLAYMSAFLALGQETAFKGDKPDGERGWFGRRLPMLTEEDAFRMLQQLGRASHEERLFLAYDNLDQFDDVFFQQLCYNIQHAEQAKDQDRSRFLNLLFQMVLDMQQRVLLVDESLVEQLLENNQEEVVVLGPQATPRLKGDDPSDAGAARELLKRARSQVHGGRPEDAEQDLRHALAFYERQTDTRSKAECHSLLGQCCATAGRLEEAERHWQAAAAEYQIVGDQAGLATVYSTHASCYLDRDEPSRALPLLEQAEGAASRLGDEDSIARANGNLGAAFLALGRLPEARRRLETALALKRHSTRQAGLTQILGNLTNLYRKLGEHELAQQTRDEVFAILEASGDHQILTRMCVNEAADEKHKLHHTEAESLLLRAQAYARQSGDAILVAKVAFNLAHIYRELGRFTEARQQLAQSTKAYEHAGNRVAYLVARITEAELALLAGDPKGAIPILCEVNEQAAGSFDQAQRLLVLSNLVQALIGAGEQEQANHYAQQIRDLAREILQVNGESETAAKRLSAVMSLGRVAVDLDRDLVAALEYREWAVKLARESGSESLPDILGDLASVLRYMGRLGDSARIHEECVALCRKSGRTNLLCSSLLNYGTVLRELGELQHALVVLRECVDNTTRANQLNVLPTALVRLGLVLHDLGSWDEARAVQRRAVELARRLGAGAVLAEALSALAWMSLQADELSEALGLAQEALQHAPPGAPCPEAHRVLAMVYKEQGDLAKAQEQLEFALVAGPGPGVNRALDPLYAAQMAMEAQNYEVAEQRLDEALESLTSETISPLTARILMLRGQVHEARDRTDSAITDYRRTVEVLQHLTGGLLHEEHKSGVLTELVSTVARLTQLYLHRKNDPVAAYELLEWLKSRSLVERLRLVHTTAPTSLAPDLLRREEALRTELREKEVTVHNSRTPEQRGRSVEELERAWRAYQALLDELASSFPEFVSLKRGSNIALDQVRALLR